MQLNVARLPQLDCLVRHDGLFQQNHLREFMKTTKHLRNYGIGALQSTRTEIDEFFFPQPTLLKHSYIGFIFLKKRIRF